jgi:PAS domain S-box-containing protein
MEKRRRRDAEEALRQSEERYRALVETASDWIWEIDAEARYTYASPRIADLLGYRPEDVLGRTPFDLMPEAEARRMRRVFEHSASRRAPLVTAEHDTRHRDGRRVVLETSGVPILSGGNALLGYRGMARDVTARKRGDEWLRTLGRAVEQSPASIIITDRRGAIEFVNPRFTEVSGFTAAEVMGANPRLLQSGQTPAEVYSELWKTITSGDVWRGEFLNKRKDGTPYTETASVAPVRDATGSITHFVAVKEDVTEGRRTKATLLRTQRLESIGCLASGIAHDLNNILTPILLSASLLQEGESAARRGEAVQTIESCAGRAIEVVRQLLSFARGREVPRQPVQVRHLIREVASVARETFPRNIVTSESCAAHLWPVMADGTQLLQVLMNLCVNARDAMPAGGTLSLRARNLLLDERLTDAPDGATAGPYVLITVQDTGTGIPDDARAHVFESFFTTKPDGEGSGLGLAMVKSIVADHRGIVSFTTDAGRGTRFDVYLPASPDRTTKTGEPEAGAAVRGRGELILVVDDERAIRDTTGATLERHGYGVLSAGNGIEALAHYSAHRDEVRLVLTDLMMPAMDGVALCRALRSLAPALPIVVAGGGLFGAAGRRALQDLAAMNVTDILQKPHDAAALTHTVARCLQDPGPAPVVVQ